ncbi:MAG: UDP-N-acetylmuramate--L-alanine ligase [Synergistaceae bacterium]|jgi:UDP-N-acetylmuramate--alanine ligase|nr:UDP-N-acetylmuramate--L-alanine ligase [Synergistaceae bacterium]
MSKAYNLMDINNYINIHLMGIGGAGMSGLALLLHSMGHTVSGCDTENTFYVGKVRAEGMEISMGHHKAHLDLYDPDLIIHTSAIAVDHPELIEARRRGIKVARRADILSLIFNSRRGVGVAGTHGKTTTSSMISLVAEFAGLDPTVAIGGELSDIGRNAKLGEGEYMVAELDESDGSFELFSPEVSVVTNVDWDHVDHYPTHRSVVEAFERFALGRKPGSSLIVCGEDAGVQQMLNSGRIGEAVVYGWGLGWDWGATNVEYLSGGGMKYTANRHGEKIGEVRLRVSGEHNILNSLAAIAAGDMMGVSFESSCRSLEIFKGAKRRMQYIGEADDVLVYDDYGHHPREIAATMAAAASAFGRRLHVVFQPHRYTRTQALYREFASVLSCADMVYLLPIYSADEAPIAGVSSFLIVDEMHSLGRWDAVVCGDFQEAVDHVCESVCSGDMVLTLGAGSIECLGRQILKRLQPRVRGDAEAVGA